MYRRTQPREYSGGSRGGAWAIILDQNEARRAENVVLDWVRHCSNIEKNVAV